MDVEFLFGEPFPRTGEQHAGFVVERLPGPKRKVGVAMCIASMRSMVSGIHGCSAQLFADDVHGRAVGGSSLVHLGDLAFVHYGLLQIMNVDDARE